MQFDRIAPYFDWMERLCASGLMQRCRIAHIQQTKNCRHALLAGEGYGRFLEALLLANPEIQVTSVEWSRKMIDYSRRRLIRRGMDLSRVTFQHANLLDCELPETQFDLIVTNFFLDCLKPAQIKRIVRLMAGSSTPDAIWLLADFRIPEATGWRRWRAKGIVAALYLFFRLTLNLPARGLTPPDSFLRAYGFKLHDRKLMSCGLMHSDFWQRPANHSLPGASTDS